MRILKKWKSFGVFTHNSSKFSKNSVRISEEFRILGVESFGYLILPQCDMLSLQKKSIVKMKLHITSISTHCLCVYQTNVRLSCPWLWDIYYCSYWTINLRNISWKWNYTCITSTSTHCTEVGFSSFFSSGSKNPPERKLAKRISVQQHLVCVYIRPMSGLSCPWPWKISW